MKTISGMQASISKGLDDVRSEHKERVVKNQLKDYRCTSQGNMMFMKLLQALEDAKTSDSPVYTANSSNNLTP